MEYLPLDELMTSADIISLHCPLVPENKYLINRETLRRMKRGVTIINTSRGGLLHTADVIDSLKSGQIAYLGIDVYEQEEKLFFKDLSGSIIEDDTIQRLMSFPNVLVTGHQAFFTEEALQQIAEITLRSVDQLINGKAVNEEVILV